MSAVTLVTALLLAACAYQSAALAVLLRFCRRRPRECLSAGPQPGVSILTPAVGVGTEFALRLESHAAQDYPKFEILVGVQGDEQAPLRAISTVRANHPGLSIKAVGIGRPEPGCNPKVHLLEALSARARYPVLLLVDADISVPRGHMRAVVKELSCQGVGAVTCLYHARPATRLASQVEACLIDTAFPGQVLLGESLQGLRFALGATIVTRSETLRAAGGLARVRRFIGDDFHIGANVAALGLQVRLSSVPVCTHLPASDRWKTVWQRQLRWSRTIRKQRPKGHAGLSVSHATTCALLALLAAPSVTWPLALATVCLRFAAAFAAVRAVGSEGSWRTLVLLPMADLLGFGAWAGSYLGSSVRWSGRKMRLGKEGRIDG